MYEQLKNTLTALLREAPAVPLYKQNLDKPLDTGCGYLAASLGRLGELRSLSAYHAQHGWMVVNTLPPFPADKYFEPEFVRQYRRAQADLEGPGFGLFPWGEVKDLTYSWLGGCVPLVQGEVDGVRLTAGSWAQGPEAPALFQVLLWENATDEVKSVAFHFSAAAGLSRAAYGQLTEGGPIPLPAPEPRFCWEAAGTFLLQDRALPGELRGRLWGDAPQQLVERADRREVYRATLQPGENKIAVACYQLAEAVQPLELGPEHLLASLRAKLDSFPASLVQRAKEDPWAYVIMRNLDYILSCCTVQLDDWACVLTDHQLLPLSWNRDAYYQLRLLREYYTAYQAELTPAQRRRIRTICRGHLRWLFGRAERTPFWARSHLATGARKDACFQLDQQCYPLLELAEHHQSFGDAALVRELTPQAEKLVGELLKLAEPGSLLLPTEETPADDALDLPYHFSSQILWLRALEALDYLREACCGPKPKFAALRRRLQAEIRRTFAAELHNRRLFAYAVDRRGEKLFYHDANDLPTVLGPEWGFCHPQDELWQNTMEFAFSPANQGGFYPGKFGGLGSIHTPHPWPLGDVQLLILARATGDAALRQRVLHKLLVLLQADGLLPEAVSAATGQVASRHWFSWPGAALALELLKLHGKDENHN